MKNDAKAICFSLSWLKANWFLLCLLFICTFSAGCTEGYKRENGRWLWVSWDEAAGKRVVIIDTIDAANFHPLSDPAYAADNNCVYHRSMIIKNADPRTFRPIAKYYWRDAKRVFFVDSEIIGADPETFRPLSKYPWARDNHDVYTGTTAMHVQDISTFTLLQGVWAKDSKAYYANSGLLDYMTVPCDNKSFTVLNDSYAKDKVRGYWQGIPIEGSDGPTFEANSEFLAKDKNRSYSGSNKQ